MDTTKMHIVVLWDGSLQSENAFRHAQRLASKSGFPVLLVRVVKKRRFLESKSEFELEVAKEKELMHTVVEELSRKYGLLPEFIIKLGDFKSCIKEVLDDFSCSIIVSPEVSSIHKGLKVNIVREFSNYGAISVPMLIANTPPLNVHDSIEVVVPVDYDSEFKDVIEWIIALSRRYGGNANFIKPVLSEAQPKQEMLNNIYFTKQMLDDNGIVYGFKTASQSEDFVDELYSFASSIDADYILTTSPNYGLMKKHSKYDDFPFVWINPRKRMYRNFN